MAKLKIGEVVSAGFAFVRPAWAVAPAPLVLVVLAAAAAQGYAVNNPGLSFWLLAQLAAQTLALGALYRSALSPDHPGDESFRIGPAGVQWGAVEWRVLGVTLIVIALVVAFLFVVAFLWAMGLTLLAAAHAIDVGGFQNLASEGLPGLQRLMAGPAGLVSAAILAPAAAILVYLAARLSLFAVQSVDTARFDIGRAWSVTRGATGAIVVAMIVIFACEVGVSAAADLAGGLIASVMGAGQGALLGVIAGAAAASAFSLPMTAGVAAYVYRVQRGGGASAAGLFS